MKKEDKNKSNLAEINLKRATRVLDWVKSKINQK